MRVLSVKERGFTVMELMVALAVFGIVMASVYGSYTASFFVINNSEYQAEIDNKARIAMERIVADLESLYLGENGLLQGEKKEINGKRADELSFTSSAHLVFTRKDHSGGQALITYSVKEDREDETLQLFRSDILFRPGDKESDEREKQKFILCDGLLAVSFAYAAGGDNDNEAELEEWDSLSDHFKEKNEGEKIPILVQITLVFAPADEDREPLLFRTAVALPLATQE